MALMLPSLTLPVHPLNSLDERLIGGDIKPVSFKVNRHMQELELWTVERNTAFTDISTIIALIETDTGSSLPTFSPSTALLDFTSERIVPTDSTAFVTKMNAYMSELQAYASANFAAFTQLNSIVSAIGAEYSLTLPSLKVPYSMTLAAEQLVIGDDDEFITKMKSYMAKLQRWERENNEALTLISQIFVSLTVESTVSLSRRGAIMTGSTESFAVTDSEAIAGRKYRLSINGAIKQTITVPDVIFTVSDLPVDGSTITRLLEFWDYDNIANLRSITDTVTAFGGVALTLNVEWYTSSPAGISLVPSGGTLNGSSQVFSISNLPSGSAWGINAGTTANPTLYYNSGNIVATGAQLITASGLPTDGSSVTIKLWIKNAIGEISTTDHLYTAYLTVIDPSDRIPIYVSTTGDDLNNGLSIGSPKRLIQSAIDIAVAGNIVYVEAGNYGNTRIITKAHGTFIDPIIIEGYQTTPGDRPSHTDFDHNSALSSSLMPLLNHGNRLDSSDAYGIIINHSYNVIRGFQVTEFTYGALLQPSMVGDVLEDVYFTSIGDYNYYSGGPAGYRGTGVKASGTDFILRGVVVVNSCGEGISTGPASARGLMDDCHTWSDEGLEPLNTFQTPPEGDEGTDYYSVIQGTDHTLQDCSANRMADYGHNGHGFRTQSASGVTYIRCIGRHMVGGAFSFKDTLGLTTLIDCAAYGLGGSGVGTNHTPGTALYFHPTGHNVTIINLTVEDVATIAYMNSGPDNISINGLNGNATSYGFQIYGGGTMDNFDLNDINITSCPNLFWLWDSTILAATGQFTNSTLTGIGSVHYLTDKSAQILFTDYTNTTINPPLTFTDSVYFSSPTNGFTLSSGSVTFTWNSGGAGNVYDLQLFTDEALTQVAVGTDSNLLDTNSIGTATTHTFTTVPQTGATLWARLRRWEDNTYSGTPWSTYLAIAEAGPIVSLDAFYVATSGSDSSDGLTENSAFRTIAKGISMAQPGDTVYVKTGDYGQVSLASVRAGTSGNPITIEGYQTTPGDKPSFTTFDNSITTGNAALMPRLRQADFNSTNYWTGCIIAHDYVNVTSFQFEDFTFGMRVSGEYNEYKNLCTINTGYPHTTGGTYVGYGYNFLEAAQYNKSTNINALNATGENIHVGGDNNEFYDIGSYGNMGRETVLTADTKGPDYYFLVSGNDNLVDGGVADQSDAMNEFHVGHGFKARGNRNVFRNVKTYNMGDSLGVETRFGLLAEDNIFEYFEVYSRAPSYKSTVGLYMDGSPARAIYRFGKVEQLSGSVSTHAIFMWNTDGGGDGHIIHDVDFINCDIWFNARTTSDVTDNITIYACTVTGGSTLFRTEHVLKDSKIYNNTFTNIPVLNDSTAGNLQLYQSQGDFAESGTGQSNTLVNCGFTLP